MLKAHDSIAWVGDRHHNDPDEPVQASARRRPHFSAGRRGRGDSRPWHVDELDIAMAGDELKRWESAPAIGLEFGAPVLTTEQVLQIIAHAEEDVQNQSVLRAETQVGLVSLSNTAPVSDRSAAILECLTRKAKPLV